MVLLKLQMNLRNKLALIGLFALSLVCALSYGESCATADP